MSKKDPKKAASALGGYSGKAVSAIKARQAAIDKQLRAMGMK